MIVEYTSLMHLMIAAGQGVFLGFISFMCVLLMLLTRSKKAAPSLFRGPIKKRHTYWR
jgi:hypothetical protein